MVWVIQGTISANGTAQIFVPANADFRRLRIMSDYPVTISVPRLLNYITAHNGLTTYSENTVYCDGQLEITSRERITGLAFSITVKNLSTSVSCRIQIILDM